MSLLDEMREAVQVAISRIMMEEFSDDGLFDVPSICAKVAERREAELLQRIAELEADIEKLAQFIMDEVPGEPSQSEGAIDTAIRLLRQWVTLDTLVTSGEYDRPDDVVVIDGKQWRVVKVSNPQRDYLDVTPLEEHR